MALDPKLLEGLVTCRWTGPAPELFLMSEVHLYASRRRLLRGWWWSWTVWASLSLRLSHTHSLTHSLTHTLTHSYTHSYTLSLTLSPTLSHTVSLSLPLAGAVFLGAGGGNGRDVALSPTLCCSTHLFKASHPSFWMLSLQDVKIGRAELLYFLLS